VKIHLGDVRNRGEHRAPNQDSEGVRVADLGYRGGGDRMWPRIAIDRESEM
jgi:hypothetical protein